jgi:hypothetical protein
MWKPLSFWLLPPTAKATIGDRLCVTERLATGGHNALPVLLFLELLGTRGRENTSCTAWDGDGLLLIKWRNASDGERERERERETSAIYNGGIDHS